MKKLGTIRLGKALVVVAAAAMAALSGLGCAIHTQAPIKEVAYDFSDYHFYDRAYAPSPDYAQSYEEYTEPVRPQPSPTAVAVQTFLPSPQGFVSAEPETPLVAQKLVRLPAP